MKERLAAAERDDASAELGELVDPSKELVGQNRFGVVVELVAVRAGEVAAANRNDVRRDGPCRVTEGLREHARLAESPSEAANAAGQRHDFHGSPESGERRLHYRSLPPRG